jgi:formylmethanofuran dehydrogenase subunit E
MKIGPYDFDQFLDLVRRFHGYAAPGVVMGGCMVETALQSMPPDVLYDAVAETRKCLPDAVQLLTPCTLGNGWLRVVDLGRFAVSLYDKDRGHGVRVSVDVEALDGWSEVKAWLLKLKPKAEQDARLLLEQIREAGSALYRRTAVRLRGRFLQRKGGGEIRVCPLCGEAYPQEHGRICRGCQGDSPYESDPNATENPMPPPFLRAIPVEQAVGRAALHDMTRIVPGVLKAPAITHGQRIGAGDVCRLQQMGRRTIYVADRGVPSDGFLHEDEAARAFAQAMAGRGVGLRLPPREGRVNLVAEQEGLLVVEEERLEQFNMVAGVMCASRKSYSLVGRQKVVAGTRAIPLFLPRQQFDRAMAVLDRGPLFRVLPLRRARVGILVTGTEVFQGLIRDRFIPVVTAKVEGLGCRVVGRRIVPDDRTAICSGVGDLMAAGSDLIVTTAGLSVDPDDVTRQGLIDAGARDILYGAPILPGAMTLVARIGPVSVMGVPACALYFKTTSFDLLLPRLLAGVPVTRRDLARLGHGALCLECKRCTYPKCSFGR